MARKVATPQKTGNEQVDRKRKEEYDDMVEAIEIMTELPELLAGAVRWLRAEKVAIAEREAAGNLEVFTNTGKTLGQFVKHNEVWCVTWLAKVMPRCSAEEQARAKAYDKDATLQQMCFLLHASSSWQLPAECKYVKVVDDIFRQRLKTVGKRQDLLTIGMQKFILPTGQMRWELGVYKVQLGADGAISKIVHRPTQDTATLEAGEGLDSSWGIANNFSDLSANFVKGKHQVLSVAKFFAKRKGPFATAQWNGKCKPEDLDAGATSLESARSGVTAVDKSEQVKTKAALEPPMAIKRKEAAAKARAKLEESAAQLKQRRVVQVSSRAAEGGS